MLSRHTAVLFVLGAALSSAAAQTIRIDGQFDEWVGQTPAATDPAGDATGAFDLTEVFATSRGTVVLLAWDTNAAVNLQAGASSDGTIITTLSFESGSTLTIDSRARKAYRDGNPADIVRWPDIGYTTLPTVALPRYETRIDVASFAAAGETVSIQFSGSDTLDSGPITIVLDQPAQSAHFRKLDRFPCTSFRLIDLNTLRNGLTNAGQRDQIGRILDAFDPEVICLQEENNNSAAVVKARLDEIDATDDGRPWNVHKQRDNVVASVFPVIGYQTTQTSDRFAAAVVDFGGGDAAFVLSIHTKCCGYAGDSSDQQRIATMHRIAAVIASFDAGTLTPELAPYAGAPTIIVGDWNHVGSDTPLTIMTDPAGPGLKHWIVRRAASDDVATWRNLGGLGFGPGLLDLVVYDRDGLRQRNGFVLDTNTLAAATLAQYGLQATDSNASDHRAIVCDFGFGGRADRDRDGCITIRDLRRQEGSPIDIDGDGLITDADTAEIRRLILSDKAHPNAGRAGQPAP